MSLLKKFQQAVNEQHLFSPADKLLLAVSGGVDSVVLCELCKQTGYDFIIAHCNFQLRGAESERDEQFVKTLGPRYAVEVLVKKFDTANYAAEKKNSIQEAARDLRYAWFAELVNGQWSIGNSQLSIVNTNTPALPIAHSPLTIHLLTAHHADDNAETIAMNFFRGTGLHGLTGIPVVSGSIRRPLLDFSKDEIIAFAAENQLEFVEDASNQSSKYTRNFFRNEIIPAISRIYPRVKDNLKDNISRFKETENLYRYMAGELKKKLCRLKGNEIHIPVKQLMAFKNKALVYEIISPYDFDEKQVEEIVKLAASDSGKYIQSPGASYRIIKHRHWFIISPVQPTEADNIIIEEKTKEITFSFGTLCLEKTSGPVSDNSRVPDSGHIAWLDAKAISFPLLLRKWKTGDYFYPLGMKKKKKLNRFLIDQKLSKTEKEKTWVIESNQRIIWVAGQRIDDRFRLVPATREVLKLQLIPAEKAGIH